MPYQSWELRPLESNTVLLTVTTVFTEVQIKIKVSSYPGVPKGQLLTFSFHASITVDLSIEMQAFVAEYKNVL